MSQQALNRGTINYVLGVWGLVSGARSMLLRLAKPWTTFVFLLNGYFYLALKTIQHLSFQCTEVATVSLPNIYGVTLEPTDFIG